MKVASVISPAVLKVSAETSLKDAAVLMVHYRLPAVPVVDEEGRPIGVLSEADVLVKEEAAEPEIGLIGRLRHRSKRRLRAAKIAARTAGEAMSEPLVTLEPWCPVTRAAGLMLEHDVQLLPIVSPAGELVGSLTRLDLVRAFARADGELEDEIREDVLHHLSFPERVELEVRNGEVRLSGEVDSPAAAEWLPSTIRHKVAGVVSVDAELSCYDDEQGRETVVAARWD